MRYYKLKIEGKDSFELNEKNTYGLNLAFQIRGSSDIRYSLPSNIEILNAPIDFFSDTESLKNSHVILEAGIKDCPFIKNQNMKANPYNPPLLSASIINTFSNWELTETRATLALGMAPNVENLKTFIIKKGESVATVVSKYVNDIFSSLNSSFKLNVDPSAENIIFENIQTMVFQFEKESVGNINLIKQCADFLSQWGMKIALQTDAQYYIYSDEFNTRDGSITIQPYQLLSQPTWSDAAHVSMEMSLDSRILLGSIITIPENLELYSGNLGDDISGVILRSAVDARILQTGNYLVDEVIHVGDSRNPDPKAWSTVVKCIRKN